MVRGPAYFPTKGACIYCGATDTELTDEHIVPYALGGTHVLREASCRACAKITAKFEQKVARDLWGDARTAFNQPTRRKRERKGHIIVPDPHDRSKHTTVPAGDYPAGFVFYKMGKAGLLQGLPEDVDLSALWQFVVIDDEQRRHSFHSKHPGKLVIQFRHVPDDFARLIAKIGYGQVLTALDLADFRPICVPYIIGTKSNPSCIIGGTFDEQMPEPENGYSLSTVAFGTLSRLIIVAIIRLYANTHAPAYHAVIGDVLGGEQVAVVMKKLDVGTDEINPATRRNLDRHAHWLPSVWPLPLWAD